MANNGNKVGTRRFVLGTVAGVAAGAVLTITALSLVPTRPSSSATPRPDSPAATSTAAAPQTPATEAPGGQTPASPTPQASAAPGDLVTPASGSWLAMTHWMPKSSNSLDEASAYARNRSLNGQVLVVVDTDAVTLRGGKKGQYAISVTGLADMRAATSACVTLGLTPGSQCGRYQIA